VVQLFREKLDYAYLGNWEDRLDNSNIEEELLTSYLTKKKYSPTQITRALYELGSALER
jgi:type I restriction enzyme, R subunit